MFPAPRNRLSGPELQHANFPYAPTQPPATSKHATFYRVSQKFPLLDQTNSTPAWFNTVPALCFILLYLLKSSVRWQMIVRDVMSCSNVEISQRNHDGGSIFIRNAGNRTRLHGVTYVKTVFCTAPTFRTADSHNIWWYSITRQDPYSEDNSTRSQDQYSEDNSTRRQD